jgi:hypothetical protein
MYETNGGMYMREEELERFIRGFKHVGHMEVIQKIIPELEEIAKTQWNAPLNRYIEKLKKDYGVEVPNGREG